LQQPLNPALVSHDNHQRPVSSTDGLRYKQAVQQQSSSTDAALSASSGMGATPANGISCVAGMSQAAVDAAAALQTPAAAVPPLQQQQQQQQLGVAKPPGSSSTADSTSSASGLAPGAAVWSREHHTPEQQQQQQQQLGLVPDQQALQGSGLLTAHVPGSSTISSTADGCRHSTDSTSSNARASSSNSSSSVQQQGENSPWASQSMTAGLVQSQQEVQEAQDHSAFVQQQQEQQQEQQQGQQQQQPRQGSQENNDLDDVSSGEELDGLGDLGSSDNEGERFLQVGPGGSKNKACTTRLVVQHVLCGMSVSMLGTGG
jgi:hypothetical protein